MEFLDGSYFWEGNPRYAQANQTEHDKFYRNAVGVDANGASVSDPKDVSTYAHMFGCWETLHIIKKGMEESGYAGPGDKGILDILSTASINLALSPGPSSRSQNL